MAKGKADAVGGGSIGGFIGFAVGGPLGAVIGGAIGGLIGCNNIIDGAVAFLESGAKKLAKDTKYTTEQRDKFSELHERAKEIREYREQHK